MADDASEERDARDVRGPCRTATLAAVLHRDDVDPTRRGGRPHRAPTLLVAVGLVAWAVAACGGDATPAGEQTFVVPATGAAGGVDDAADAIASEADVLRAGDAAVAAAGGEVIRTSVDLMGYVVQLRQEDGTFSTVQLDIGFGVVFVEDLAPGRRAGELADDVDLRRAVDLALEVALGEEIGAAGDGIVVGAELEPDGYDIDIQYPDGRVLEVRLDDAWAPTGTRIRGG
ncbi:MAG: hypothetical protein F2534_16905 [Actinobacteria bacterium]|jgi:hypothetical protein|nr:hypothetical protein [Actinomycetota bacterium]